MDTINTIQKDILIHFLYYRSTLQYTTSDTPFLPMRNNLASSVDHQKSHRHFMEKNMNKCSWRCIAIFFVVLAVILSAALAYITGKFVYIFSCLFTTFSCLFTTFSCLFILSAVCLLKSKFSCLFTKFSCLFTTFSCLFTFPYLIIFCSLQFPSCVLPKCQSLCSGGRK